MAAAEDGDLARLMAEAAGASPMTRIEYRDRLAAFGVAGIDAIAPWLSDPQLGAFAVRVIVAAARGDQTARAVQVLEDQRDAAGTEAIRLDIDAAITAVQPRAPGGAPKPSSGYEELGESELGGRRAIRYRIAAHRERGHFNVPRDVMNQLGIPTDGVVALQVRRARTDGLVFEGVVGLASGTEVYPTNDDPTTVALSGLTAYELIDVTVARAE